MLVKSLMAGFTLKRVKTGVEVLFGLTAARKRNCIVIAALVQLQHYTDKTRTPFLVSRI